MNFVTSPPLPTPIINKPGLSTACRGFQGSRTAKIGTVLGTTAQLMTPYLMCRDC